MATTPSERRLDVREIDGAPFGDIMAALGELEDGERLRLVAGFEPKPLYEVLEMRGFVYETERHDGTEWHVLIEPN